MLPDDDEIMRRAEELYRTWTLVEETEASRPSAVALADLLGFLGEGRPLTHEQQRALFADSRLRAEFQCLKADFALSAGAQAGEGGRAVEAVRRPLEMPTQIAAASTAAADFLRPFEGGTLRICPAGIDEQVYIVITLDDPALVPRALLIEGQSRNRIEQMPLPARDGDGEIVLIKDLAEPADASLVELLRDPTATGVFLG